MEQSKHLIQGSNEWLEFRKKKLGASDTPIIMGVSPYKSPYDLWQEKTGRKGSQKSTRQMQMGNAMEPKIRDLFKEEFGDLALPKVIEQGPEDYEYMMASLDGLTIDNNILEIKYCNRKVFDLAKEGKVAEHYYPQLQHQLFCVPKAETCFFYCYHGGETALVRVKRDQAFINDMLSKISEFWDHIQNDVPPPIEESDSLCIENDSEFESAVVEWRKASHELKHWKTVEAEARANLLDRTDDGNCHGYGVKIKRIFRETTDYKKACEEYLIDLTKYVKPSIGYWKIKEV